MVGISPDSVESHESFCSAQGFGFDLLSDIGGEVGRLYGTWAAEGSPGRVTYVIGPDGRIAGFFAGARDFEQHAAEALATLERIAGTVE